MYQTKTGYAVAFGLLLVAGHVSAGQHTFYHVKTYGHVSGGAVPVPVAGQSFAAPQALYSAPAPYHAVPQAVYSAPAPYFAAPQAVYSAPAPYYAAPMQQYYTHHIITNAYTLAAPPTALDAAPSSTSQDIATVKKNTATILGLLQSKGVGASGVSNPPEATSSLDNAAQFATTLKSPEDIDLHTAIVGAEKAKAEAILKYLDNKKKSLSK